MGVYVSVLQLLTRASRIHASMEVFALRMGEGFGALVAIITQERRVNVGTTCFNTI